MTKIEFIINKINLQEKIKQLTWINIVTCGNCGDVLLHELKEEYIQCICGVKIDVSDCPDLYYLGTENNEIYNWYSLN